MRDRETANQVPPHDDDAELWLLGSFYLDPDWMDDPECHVTREDFYHESHGIAFEVLRILQANRIPPDKTTFKAAMREVGQSEESANRILLPIAEIPHAERAKHYAGIVRKHSAKRVLRNNLRLALEAVESDASPEECQVAIDAIASEPVGTSKRRAVTLADLLGEIDPRKLPPRQVFPIGEGFEAVDLSPGKLVLIGAPPGGGKTAVAGQWTTEAMLNDSDLRALVANIEMPPRDLIHRQLSRLSGVPLREILNRHPTLGRVWGDQIEHGLSLLGEIKDRLSFACEPQYIESVAAQAKAMKPDLIVLDYIQRIGPRGGHENVRESISEVMTHARRMADSGACVIAISAVGRQSSSKSKSDQYKLGLSSFRESGDLEYSADDAWVMEPGEEIRQGVRQVSLRRVKARNGALCELPLEFDGNVQRIEVASGLAIHEPDTEVI